MEAGDGGFLQHSDPNLNGFLDGLNNMSADLLDAELLEATSLLPSLSKDDPALQHNKTEQQNSYAHRAHYGQHAPPAMASPEQSAAAGVNAGPHGQGVPSPPDTEATTSASTVKRSRQQAEEAHDDSTKHRASSSRATRQRRKANSAQDEKPGTPHAQQMSTQAEPQGGLHQQQLQPPMEHQQNEQHNYIGRNSSMPPKQQQHDPAGRAFSVPPPHRDPNIQQPITISEPELKQAYCNSVQALKDYITVTNLLSYDILGKNLPEKLTGDLKTLIHQISKVCLQAIKPDTPYVINVISKDYSQATTVDWELDKGHWTNVIAHLQLTENQVLAILRARSAHVDKLMGLYHERAVLAKQAADLAAASCTQGNARLGVEDHSMLGILMRHGYLYCARNVITLHRGLELMRDSLGREQKMVMELFLKIVYQVLSPVQAALFVVESFPYHCDVLAMANVLSMMYGSKLDAMASMGPDMGMHNAGLHGPMSSMGSMQDLQRSMSLVNGNTPTANGGAPMRGDGLARLRSFLDTATQPPFSVDNMMGPAGNLQSNRAMSFGGPMGSQPLQPTNSRPLSGMPSIDSMTPMGMGMGMHGMGGPPSMGNGPYPGLQHAGSIKQPNGMPGGGMPGLQGPGMPCGNMQGSGLGLDMQSMGSGEMPMGGPSGMGPRGSMPNSNMFNGRSSMSLPSDGGPSGQGGMMGQMGNDPLSGLLPLDLAGMGAQGGGKQAQGRNGSDSMLPPQGIVGNPGMGMPGGMGMNGNNGTPEGSSGFPGSPARGGKQGHVMRNPNSNAPSGFGTGPGARLLGSGGNIPGMGGPLGPGNGMHSGLPTISSGHNVGLNPSLSRELSSGMTAEMAQAYRNFSKGANGMHTPSSPMVDMRGMGMDTRNGNMPMGMETNARMGLGVENRSVGGIDMRSSGGLDVRGLSMEVRGPPMDMGMLSMPGGMERYNSNGRPPSGHGGAQVDMSKGMYGVDMNMQRSPLHAQQGQQQQGQQQGQQQQQQPPGQQQQQGSSSPLLPQGSNGFGRGASAGSNNPGTGMSQLSQGGRLSQPSSVTMNNMLPGSMVDMPWGIGNPSNGNGISNGNGKLTSMCSGLNTLGMPPNTLAVPPPGPSHANPMNGAGGPGGKSMQGNGGSGSSLPVISVPKEPS